MKTLYRVSFDHYSQEDSKKGIETYFITDNNGEEKVVSWFLDDIWHYMEEKELQEIMTLCRQGAFEEGSEAQARAHKLGIEVLNKDEIQGSRLDLVRFNCGEFEDVEEAYYGATRFNWKEVSYISDEDAETLVRLGIASIL